MRGPGTGAHRGDADAVDTSEPWGPEAWVSLSRSVGVRDAPALGWGWSTVLFSGPTRPPILGSGRKAGPQWTQGTHGSPAQHLASCPPAGGPGFSAGLRTSNLVHPPPGGSDHKEWRFALGPSRNERPPHHANLSLPPATQDLGLRFCHRNKQVGVSQGHILHFC